MRDRAPARLITTLAAVLCAAALLSCGGRHDIWSSAILARAGTVWNYNVVFTGGFTDGDAWSVPLRAHVRVRRPNRPASRIANLDAIWQIAYEDSARRVDSTFVYALGDTITTAPIHLTNLMNLSHTYVFPLSVGERWTGSYCCADSFRVAGIDTVTVPAGRFTAYRIDRLVAGPGFSVTSTTWLSPDVGIIRQIEQKSEMGHTAGATWTLTGYWLLSDDPGSAPIFGGDESLPDPHKRP